MENDNKERVLQQTTSTQKHKTISNLKTSKEPPSLGSANTTKA